MFRASGYHNNGCYGHMALTEVQMIYGYMDDRHMAVTDIV